MRLVRRRSTVLLSATLLAGAALAFEPILLSNLPGPAGTEFGGAALAQPAGTLVLEDQTFAFAGTTYRAKRIAFSGLTSSRAEVEAIFDKGSSEPLAARLAKLTAKEIAIPELVLEQKVQDLHTTTTYRNIVVTDVVAGKIASAVAEGGVMDSATPKGRLAFAQGRMSLVDVDGPEVARVYTQRATTATAPLVKLYGRFEAEDIRMTDGKDVDLRVARLAGHDFYGRPTRESWAEFYARMAAMKPGEQTDKTQVGPMMSGMADMLGAFDTSLMEVTGIQIKAAGDEGVGRIGRMAYTGSVGGATPEVRLEGFAFTGKDGTARIDAISATGFSFRPTFEGLGSLGGTKVEDLDAAALRKLIPTIGTIRFSGFDFDLPNSEKGAGGLDRVRFSLKELELTADKPLNGIPTNISFALQNFAFGLPGDTQEEGLKDLAALGYKDLNVSFGASANWNEAAKELLLREVSARGLDMGGFSFKGVLGNVTKEVFGPDTALATVALLGATAKNAELVVENTGLFDRYLAQEAKKQKKAPEALRREYGTAAAIGIPALLGNSAQAKELAQAIARFVAKPGKLTISAKAKDPTGLGVADLALVGEPATLLQKLEIKATAE